MAISGYPVAPPLTHVSPGVASKSENPRRQPRRPRPKRCAAARRGTRMATAAGPDADLTTWDVVYIIMFNLTDLLV